MVRSETQKAWSVVILSSVLAACLLAALLWATAPAAEAAGRYKTVTRTFSNAQPIAINDFGAASPYASEIAAGGFKRGKVLDVNVTLKGFGHTFPDDVDAMVSHRGANRTVMSDAGTDLDATGLTLRLDDEAAEPLPDAAQLTGGTFEPTNYFAPDSDEFPAPAPAPSGIPKLSGFDGSNPNGTWGLWVVDDETQDSGQLSGGWSVTIKARVLR